MRYGNRKWFFAGILLGMIFLTACSGDKSVQKAGESYACISAKEARGLMEKESGYVILDVRTQEEYDEGHIKGAVLLPDYEIESRAAEKLPDKEQLILVYCRSGRRSKVAAEALVKLGYSNVKEFGGIIDWPYEIEK